MKFTLRGKVIFFATNNINKFNEARKVLSQHGIAAGMLRAKSLEIQSDDIDEIAATSVECAFRHCHLPVIVEDAGLFIDVLNGFPGPYSAYVYRTLGNAGMLMCMRGKSDRKAVFRSVIAYLDEDLDSPRLFEGEVYGEITRTEKRTNAKSGFGFDPVFVPTGSRKTFAQMDLAEKNKLSHRAKAMSSFAQWYSKLRVR
jgi:XTP/dITP diphosphohydrolase